MKKLIIFTTLCTIFLSLSLITNAQTWTIQHTVANEEFHHINFLDANTGWAFRKGQCIKTTDGGTTWSPQNMGNGQADFRILDSYIFDANNIVAVGRHENLEAVIIKTIDGGNTWTSQTNFSERLFAVAFSNANDGWAVGDKGIGYRTTDGGTTWTLASFSNDDLMSITFPTSTLGIAVGEMGLIYRTTDGGTTWNPMTSNTTFDLNKVRFIDASNGWIVGMNGTILTTTDGGATWSAQTSNTAFNLNDVAVYNNYGIAVGIAGTVLLTTDGGTTWSPQTTNIATEILSVTIVDENNAWATDAVGNIWHFGGTVNTSTIAISKQVKVYPNPMMNFTKIDLENGEIIDKILIYNTIGDIIIAKTVNSQTTTLDKGNLTTGLYFIEIITENNQRIMKPLQIL